MQLFPYDMDLVYADAILHAHWRRNAAAASLCDIGLMFAPDEGTRPSASLRASSHRAFSPIRNDKGKMGNCSRRNSVIVRLVAFLLLVGSAYAQNVVHYTATNTNVKYLFATAEPVARLKSGAILDTNTLDCFGNA